jgi:hypothetical protein
MPAVPDQGGIVPVLWQPEIQTSLAANPYGPPTFTLNVITTQWIDEGVIFQFQVWNGLQYTYQYVSDSVTGSDGLLGKFELIVRKPIPPNTVLVVSITSTATTMYSYSGAVQYSNVGTGLSCPFTRFSSCICFAYAPTTTGARVPERGQPQFAIGFNYRNASDPDQLQNCTPSTTYTPLATAPNFPDQFSNYSTPWVFLYSVVYPCMQRFPVVDPSILPDCSDVVGIKFEFSIAANSRASWSSLRNIITQPYTVHRDYYESVTHWYPYSSIPLFVGNEVLTADMGPFQWAAMAGQLVVVYFRPRPLEIDTNTEPIPGYDPAEIAFLVTVPIPPNSTIFFTIDAYDSLHSGFGPRDNSTSGNFINQDPSFRWTTVSDIVPAGTVVFITGIGTSDIRIQDAQYMLNVGHILGNTTIGRAVVSVIALGVWTNFGSGSARPIDASQFITAALSNQYAGDFPSLAPCLTINKNLFYGPGIYGQYQLFDNMGLPGTVQAPMINSAVFKLLPKDTIVEPTTLPVFTNMACFHF